MSYNNLTWNSDKVKKNKNEYKSKKMKFEKKTKEALKILLNFRTNIYQKIYYLITTPDIQSWKDFDFLSSKTKINNFISKLENEIKIITKDSFNYDKYKPAILCILGKGASKYNDNLIKNMYLTKLQNIIFILKDNDEDNGGIKEVKENSIGI